MRSVQDNFLSANKKDTIFVRFFEPADENTRIAGIIQLSHGMCEYVDRYTELARFFTSLGYVFCGNDHLGHGKSAKDTSSLGFTSEGGGVDFMVEDLHTVTLMAKKRYKNAPLVLFGHSMGSFLARIYITKYADDLCGAIICGTGGGESPTAMGKALAKTLMAIHGEHHRSKLLDGIAFGSYNSKFKNENCPKAWLTHDTQVREKYKKDPFCAYTFTLRGFYDLFDMLGRVSANTWAPSVPKSLDILLIAGEDDPVGNYGRGVREVFDKLRSSGNTKTQLVLLEGARHEPHNELPKIKEKFLMSLLSFTEEVIKG